MIAAKDEKFLEDASRVREIRISRDERESERTVSPIRATNFTHSRNTLLSLGRRELYVKRHREKKKRTDRTFLTRTRVIIAASRGGHVVTLPNYFLDKCLAGSVRVGDCDTKERREISRAAITCQDKVAADFKRNTACFFLLYRVLGKVASNFRSA